MAYKITNFHGMTASTTSLTQTGTVTEGQWGAWTKYNYPGTDTEPPSPTLTDMPKYNKRFDEWQGRTGGGVSPTTIFNFTEDAANSKRTTTITNPDGSISETVMNLKPGLWDDGLVKDTIIKTGSGVEKTKNVLTWEEGPTGAGGRRNPRIKQVEATATLNDIGLVVSTGSGLWTIVLKYDSFGRLKEGIDARGVKTEFKIYDTLNRIKEIEFSDGTPKVTYTYDQARTGFFNKGALTRVETAEGGTARPDTPVTATELDYDNLGRVKNHR